MQCQSLRCPVSGHNAFILQHPLWLLVYHRVLAGLFVTLVSWLLECPRFIASVQSINWTENDYLHVCACNQLAHRHFVQHVQHCLPGRLVTCLFEHLSSMTA